MNISGKRMITIQMAMWMRISKRLFMSNSLMGLYTNHCNLLDLAAIAVPEDADDHEDPFGITLFALHENEHLADGVARAFLAAGGTQAERAMEPAAKEASA